uniref:Uncharacterized protein n=1 Tax=Romanomermis culicivorax TaxID=13658 RepID=A0A915L5N3_ROMCU
MVRASSVFIRESMILAVHTYPSMTIEFFSIAVQNQFISKERKDRNAHFVVGKAFMRMEVENKNDSSSFKSDNFIGIMLPSNSVDQPDIAISLALEL